MRKVRIQIPVTQKMRDKIQKDADKKGVSLAEQVRYLLNMYYDNNLKDLKDE